MHLLVSLTALAFGSLVRAHTAPNDSTFDYIVVGGGTCGLVMANRLTEDLSITVAIIEVGDSVLNNPNVTSTSSYGAALGTSIDWAYESARQVYADNMTRIYNAGKAIGGTSTINGMTYIRAEDVQIDAIEKIGNPGWTWASLLPYYQKSEKLQPPTAAQKAGGATYRPPFHGRSGPVNVGWNPLLPPKDIQDSIKQVWHKLGYSKNPDMSSGKLRGYGVWPQTLDVATRMRADAARSYFWPYASRKNLVLFENTTAIKLVWAHTYNETNVVTASGVQVVAPNGTEFVLSARREVIISAGSLRSPGLLELSGVGNPIILARHGLPVRVDLPGVGENLQDQPNNNIQRTLAKSATGYPTYVTYATTSDLFGSNASAVAQWVKSSIPRYARKIALAMEKGATTAHIQERLLTQQFDLIFDKLVPVAEILTAPFGSTATAAFWVLLPFSRGSVHLSSREVSAPPLINTNFFMLDWDLAVQVATAKLSRKALGLLGTRNSTESSPGFKDVPDNASNAQWEHWIKKSFVSNNHPVGTLAMMDRTLGGVVSPELRVYGTSNVRVVDASILPFQVDGHLTSTLYAMAEKAADVVKAHHETCITTS